MRRLTSSAIPTATPSRTRSPTRCSAPPARRHRRDVPRHRPREPRARLHRDAPRSPSTRVRDARAGVVHNADVTVVAERPKIGPHRERCARASPRRSASTSADVSVKGKTNEGMGWIGRGEGLACIAVASLAPRDAALTWTAFSTGSARCRRRRCTSCSRCVAAIENFFPPIPGRRRSSRSAAFSPRASRRSPIPRSSPSWSATSAARWRCIALGRRYGAEWIRRRLHVMGEGCRAARSSTGTTGSDFRRCFSAASFPACAPSFRRSRARFELPRRPARSSPSPRVGHLVRDARHRSRIRLGTELGAHRRRAIGRVQTGAAIVRRRDRRWSGAIGVVDRCDGGGARERRPRRVSPMRVRRFPARAFDDFLLARAGRVAAHARGVRARPRAVRDATRRSRARATPPDVSREAAARVRLPPEGPRARARVDPAQRLGAAHLLPVPARRRPRRARSERAARDAEAMADAARGADASPRSSGCSPRRRSTSRWPSATARCWSSRTARGCASPSGSRSACATCCSTSGSCASSARAARSASCRSAARAIGARRDLPARAAAAARAGKGEGRALPQRARRAADAHGRLEDPPEVRRARGHHEARVAAHAATLVRDPPARGRRRPARGAGDAWPRRHLDDADLHARGPRVPATAFTAQFHPRGDASPCSSSSTTTTRSPTTSSSTSASWARSSSCAATTRSRSTRSARWRRARSSSRPARARPPRRASRVPRHSALGQHHPDAWRLPRAPGDRRGVRRAGRARRPRHARQDVADRHDGTRSVRRDCRRPLPGDALSFAHRRARVAARRARGHSPSRRTTRPRSTRCGTARIRSGACSSIPESILTDRGKTILRELPRARGMSRIGRVFAVRRVRRGDPGRRAITVGADRGARAAGAAIIVRRALADAHDVIVADSDASTGPAARNRRHREHRDLGGDASPSAPPCTATSSWSAATSSSVPALDRWPNRRDRRRRVRSTLGVGEGGTESLRDHTFDVSRSADATTRLSVRRDERRPGVELPLLRRAPHSVV